MSVVFIDAVSETLPAANTTIYTVPITVDSATIIAGNCTNASGAAATLVVNIVKSGDSAATSNVYLPSATINADAQNPLSEIVGLVLAPGDFISAIAGTTSALNFKVSIKEISS